jgi:hypothetical protein
MVRVGQASRYPDIRRRAKAGRMDYETALAIDDPEAADW